MRKGVGRLSVMDVASRRLTPGAAKCSGAPVTVAIKAIVKLSKNFEHDQRVAVVPALPRHVVFDNKFGSKSYAH